MGKILSRYIFRETAQTWLAVTGVLLIILLTDQFARVLDDAAGAEIPKEAIFAVMGLSSIQYLTILVPVGIFLAIILALARMYRDSEMAAMMACGIGNMALYRPIMILSLGLAAGVSWLALDAGPAAQRAVQQIADEAKKSADLGLLKPGRFISFGREQAILYAEKISDDGQLSNVFVQRRRGDRVIVIVAEKAGQQNDEETGKKILTFTNGERYEGVPGSPEVRIMKFAEHGIPFEIRESKPGDLPEEAKPLSELLAVADPAAIAELQWRVSVPITLLVLTLLAVPLSKAPPRQGRYNNLAIGILLYVIYSNMLGASKAWVEKETISPWIGLWWVHGMFILYAAIMLMRQNGVFRGMFNAAPVKSSHENS
jgi:lipopolysaccharide export system permease protein